MTNCLVLWTEDKQMQYLSSDTCKEEGEREKKTPKGN